MSGLIEYLLAFSCKRRHFCPSCHQKRALEFGEWLCENVLKHLDLWNVNRKPPPCANSPPAGSYIIYDQSLSPSADDYIIDVDYPIETYR